MTSSASVLLAQLAPRTHDVDANVAAACGLLDEHPGADLAVFPELYLSAYALRGLEPVDPEATASLEPLMEAARRHKTAVVTGAPERVGDSMANAALCIDERGQLVARYRKVHLYAAENRFFRAGDEYVVVALGGIAVAPIVCYDLEFPEPARAVSAAGAELLVTISANMDPYAEHHALFVRARAVENGIAHVYVNCVGTEGRLRFCGGSTVTDAAGRVVAQLPAYRPAVRSVTVPLGRPEDPAAPDYLAERRPEVKVRALTAVARPGD